KNRGSWAIMGRRGTGKECGLPLRRQALVVIALLLVAAHGPAAERVLRLDVGDTSTAQDETLACVFRQLQQPYRLEKVPRRRGLHDLQNQNIDGYFPALQQADLDQHAQLSAPLSLEKWYWIGDSEAGLFAPGFPGEQRIGAVAGSNQALWLQQVGLAVHEWVNSEEQLLALLKKNRIDTYLVNRPAYDASLHRLHPHQSVHVRFARNAPLGAYFSTDCVAAQPSFPERFHRQLGQCLPEVSSLDDNERRRIRHLVDVQVRPWLGNAAIMTALHEASSRQLSPAQRDSIDAQWREEVARQDFHLVDSFLSRPVSKFLQLQKTRNHGLVTELILVDRDGHNLGIADATSDFWQGDEAKFIQAAGVGSGGLYISDIRYDVSAQHFLVHASIPLHDGQALAGMLIVGINVEMALADESPPTASG